MLYLLIFILIFPVKFIPNQILSKLSKRENGLNSFLDDCRLSPYPTVTVIFVKI